MRSGRQADRQWARADATRQALLNAARAAFGEHGYSDAGIAEIVARSGISVGSLYHHYGGKAGLFLALWEEHTGRQERAAAEAVARARQAGERDPIAQFIAGSRAYLQVCWESRETALLFHESEGPSGFSLMRRSRARTWINQNTRLLQGSSRVLGLVLTTVIGEAGREIATAEDRAEADAIVEEICAILIRLSSPAPAGAQAQAQEKT